MDKKTLVRILDDVFTQFGYKKKGSKWFIENEEIRKELVLSKSRYGGNLYYLDLNTIVKKVDLDGCTSHIVDGFGLGKSKSGFTIDQLLNLDNELGDSEREQELREYASYFMNNSRWHLIQSESELLKDLKARDNLDDVLGVLQKYFELI